jgi:hypothetical protein
MGTVYRSTDASAPVLSGTVGALIGVLDACLVNGYGSKAAAGWTKPFSGTNTAVYRGGSGVQHYYQVDDSAAGAGGAQEALIRGWVTASGVGTGTGDFPVSGTNRWVRKSAAASGTARAWIVVADDRSAYILTYSGDVTGAFMVGLGEFYSVFTGDNYRSFLGARNSVNSALASVEAPMSPSQALGAGATTLARNYTSLGGAFNAAGMWAMTQWTGPLATGKWEGGLAYPNPSDGGLYIAKVTLWEASNNIRGYLRGLYALAHPGSAFSDGDTFSGVGLYSGRTFQIVKPVAGAAGSTTAAIAFETTAWDSSI